MPVLGLKGQENITPVTKRKNERGRVLVVEQMISVGHKGFETKVGKSATGDKEFDVG